MPAGSQKEEKIRWMCGLVEGRLGTAAKKRGYYFERISSADIPPIWRFTKEQVPVYIFDVDPHGFSEYGIFIGYLPHLELAASVMRTDGIDPRYHNYLRRYLLPRVTGKTMKRKIKLITPNNQAFETFLDDYESKVKEELKQEAFALGITL